MGSTSTTSEGVEIFFLPWNMAGHLRPMTAMAKLFSSRGAKPTILTSTPHALPISLSSLPLKNPQNMQDSLRDLLLEHHPLPSCIIFDAIFPWVVDVAEEFSFPAFAFHGSSSFTSCANSALHLHPPPPSEKSFFIPDLPHRVELLRTQMPNLDIPHIASLLKDFALSKARCHGLIMNSFEELEKEYLEKIRGVLGKDVWAVGPLPMIGDMDHGEADGLLQWLDGKEPGSVVYVCFGSMGKVGDEQNCEIAAALEMLGHPFVWVTSACSEDELFSKNGRKNGIVISGWAPQIDILKRGAIGAFVTHCGWNSCMEAIAAGVPMVTWPLMAEQFLNEKLVTQVLGVGVEVGSKIWSMTEERNLIRREEMYKAIKRVIDGGEESATLRRRAGELAVLAKKAISEGGSSWNDVGCLIEQLRQGKWLSKKHMRI